MNFKYFDVEMSRKHNIILQKYNTNESVTGAEHQELSRNDQIYIIVLHVFIRKSYEVN